MGDPDVHGRPNIRIVIERRHTQNDLRVRGTLRNELRAACGAKVAILAWRGFVAVHQIFACHPAKILSTRMCLVTCDTVAKCDRRIEAIDLVANGPTPALNAFSTTTVHIFCLKRGIVGRVTRDEAAPWRQLSDRSRESRYASIK